MTIATGILAMVALTVFGTLAIAVTYAILVRGRLWRRELFSLRTLPFLVMGLAVGATTLGIGFAAKCAADLALGEAVADIVTDCDDQLTLILNIDAAALVEDMAKTNGVFSAEDLRRSMRELSLDEMTLVDARGLIVQTTAPGAVAGQSFFSDERLQRPYRELLAGRRVSVSEPFRPSTTQADRIMKYFAIADANGGFLQVGFTWETFEREFPRFILPLFEHRTVGEKGFCIALGPDGRVEVEVPGHPEARGRTAEEIGLSPRKLAVPPGRIFRAGLFGTRCRCLSYPETVAGRRLFAAIPVSEGQGAALALAALVALVLFAVFLCFRLLLRRFHQQQARIDALREAEADRRARDMALARAVQRAELRTDGARGDGYRLRAIMDAAREVGGDFYDYYTLSDDRLVLTIADVSGKGIPAALFMMKSRATLKACVYEQASLADAVAAANAQLAQKNPAELFVTVWIGVWDRRTGRLEYVSGGHNPPLVKRRDGSVEWLAAPRCAALGVFETARYRGTETHLGAGDALLLYTDGVTEAMDVSGELFGNDRLEATVRRAALPIVPAVISDVGAFVAGAEQSDDLTMLELSVDDFKEKTR